MRSEDSLVNLDQPEPSAEGLQNRVCVWSDQLLAGWPDAIAGLVGLAGASFANGDFEAGGGGHTSRLTELAPNSYDHWFNLGVALQRLWGRLPASAAAYQRAGLIRPEATFAHINLGVVDRELGDLAGSRSAFEHAVQAALLLERADLKLELASIVEGLGSLEEAEGMYAALVKTNPDLENAWFRLGYLRLQRGDHAGSIPAFEACVKSQPDWPEAEMNLGLGHTRAGRTTRPGRGAVG